MKPKNLLLSTLCCLFTLLSSCKDDDNSPLRFYDSEYEVPMGGRRYLGIESGNGDYLLEITEKGIAGAGTETGWTGVPAGRMIYVTGILTGKTTLKVTDKATMETCTLPIKVVDNYEDFRLSRSSLSMTQWRPEPSARHFGHFPDQQLRTGCLFFQAGRTDRLFIRSGADYPRKV